MSMSRIEPFALTCEISDVRSKNLCYNACFCEVHRRENRIKTVVPEVVGSRDTIKFYDKLGYKPTEMFSLLQRDGDAFEMKNNNVLVAHAV